MNRHLIILNMLLLLAFVWLAAIAIGYHRSLVNRFEAMQSLKQGCMIRQADAFLIGKGSRLAGHSEEIFRKAAGCGVDPLLILAIAGAETGWKRSTGGNFWGLTKGGRVLHYRSVSRAVDEVLDIVEEETRLPDLARVYCPPDPEEWEGNVRECYKVMERITFVERFPSAEGEERDREAKIAEASLH